LENVGFAGLTHDQGTVYVYHDFIFKRIAKYIRGGGGNLSLMLLGGACSLNCITLQQPCSTLSVGQREKSNALLGKCLTIIPHYTEVFSWKPDRQK
jgi:hypothetical protein